MAMKKDKPFGEGGFDFFFLTEKTHFFTMWVQSWYWVYLPPALGEYVKVLSLHSGETGIKR